MEDYGVPGSHTQRVDLNPELPVSHNPCRDPSRSPCPTSCPPSRIGTPDPWRATLWGGQLFDAQSVTPQVQGSAQESCCSAQPAAAADQAGPFALD